MTQDDLDKLHARDTKMGILLMVVLVGVAVLIGWLLRAIDMRSGGIRADQPSPTVHAPQGKPCQNLSYNPVKDAYECIDDRKK